MRYFIFFGYDGTNYHGWQIQPNANSVQQELQRALSILLRKEIEVVSSVTPCVPSLDGRRPIKIGSASYACKQSKSQLSILALLVPTTSLSQFLSKRQSHIKFPRFSDFPFYPDSRGTTPAVLLPHLPTIRTSWLQG